MPTWNSQHYLQFARERTQPAIDLAARIEVSSPQNVIDLGCGPGNSTAVLAQRWPAARITGTDTSVAMLTQARREFPERNWIESDIARWPDETAESFDVIFSNAALQWIPDHGQLLPRLFHRLSPGGALAFQVPHTLDAPHQRAIRDVAESDAWRNRFKATPQSWQVESAEFYYDVFTRLGCTRSEFWFTEYVHVLDGTEAIVAWYRGTGLRPYLDQLADDPTRAAFLETYLREITPHYRPRFDGRVLMPFRRFFAIAYRSAAA